MEMAGGSTFLRSAARGVILHAFLVLLHASLQSDSVEAACAPSVALSYEESDFAIRQTRFQDFEDGLNQCLFQVWGVASVLLGGDNNNQYYWFDCFHDSLSMGSTWVRIDPEGSVDSTALTGGARISFTSQTSNYLGLYACRASDGSMEYLNITDDVPGLIPVEPNVESFAGDNVTLSTYISTTNGLLTYVQWKNAEGETVFDYPGPGQEVPALPSHLTLSDVTVEDAGTYNVTVQSREFVTYRRNTLVSLSVLVRSNITGPPPSVVEVDEWEETELVCVATGSPPPTVTWSREGSMLPVNADQQTNTLSSEDGTETVTSTLTISEVRYSDRGSYSCSAYNSLTTISHTDTAESTLNVNPMIRIESEDLISNNVVLASFGTSLVIECFGSGNLVWTTPPSQSVFTSYDPSRNVLTLSIPNFITPDRYTCSSDLDPCLEKSILITTHAVLSVSIADEEIFAVRGNPVIITAHIHSVEDVTSVLWYQNGTQLDPESDTRYTTPLSADSGVAKLEITSLVDESIGRYVVMVTSSADSVANASVEVLYPVLPSAEVSPSQQTVEVGDPVNVLCAAEGTGPLIIVWVSESGVVVAEGDHLTIATASLIHSGLYTCTVSSPFSTAQATFDLTVLERLVALIDYNDVISPTHEVSFYHGDGNSPSFRCLVNGSVSETTFTWQLSGGDSLPSVTSLDSSGAVLRWTHIVEYTDTGTYVCLVREPATGRLRSATVNLTILHDPVLDTIFPAPGITNTNLPSSITYAVPLGYTGPALTCATFASPTPPDVRWTKNSGSLPRGIETQLTKFSGGIAISELVFSSQFSVADVGTYKCEVRRAGEEEIVDSQLVELSQGDPTSSTPVDGDCESVSQESVLFQLRVATSNCLAWTQDRKSAITEEFQNFLFRLLSSTQCGDSCVTRETLTVVSLECSDVIEGGAVFRGTIETGSASNTAAVTCALSRWQRSRPLVTVEDNRFYVDSQCGLQIESYAEGECLVAVSEEGMDLNIILMVAVPVGCVVVLFAGVSFLLICAFSCRRCKGESLKISDGNGAYEVNTLSYRQTGDPTCATDINRLSVGSMSRQQDNLFYDDAAPFDDRYHNPPVSPVYDVARSPDRRPLVMALPESLPKDQGTNFNDSGVSLSAAPGSGSPPHEPRRTHVTTAAQPYQIPTASTSSLNNVGVANPLWGVEQNSTPRGERRLSEGPPPHHSPARLGGSGAVSCVTIQDRGLTRPIGQQLSTTDQTAGVSASSEDYSHLDFSPPSKSVSCLGAAPQRKWYVSSDAPYASLSEGEPAVRPYDAVRNSTHHTRSSPASSPQTKTPPTAPPTGHTYRGHPMMSSYISTTSSANSSVPSSLLTSLV